MQGGAMYALERGLHMKWLAVLFAFFGAFASFGIGCATQVNSIAEICNTNFHIPPVIMGGVIAVLTAIVIFGGIQSIANVCEKLVPFMALFYIIGCIIILGMNHDYIIPAVATICKLAFTPGAAAGGLVGTGIMMTGIVLVSTIMKNPNINMGSVTNGGQLTSAAFGQIPVLGPIILTLGIISFAYSTVLGWAYYGERCVEYFGGKKALLPYRILYVAVAAIAPVVALDLVWLIADTLNALMAIPNIIAVLLLSNVMVADTKKYINHLDAVDDTPVPVVR